MTGWLDDRENANEWLQVIDADGTPIAWAQRRDAIRFGMSVIAIETPSRYLEDPYVRYHAALCAERGVLDRGNDLNVVQNALISSNLVKKREREERLRVRAFEESILAFSPERYKGYMEAKAKIVEDDDETASVEQRVPRSIEEVLAVLSAFSEGEPSDSDKDKEHAEGWLTSLLSNDELSEMQDDDG